MRNLLSLFLGLSVISVAAESECVETEDSILLKWNGKPVLHYNKAVQSPPEGMKPYYRRSGYIHPVYNPSGQVVTGDFAEDHPHQHALFFAWTKCKFEGRPLEFWNQRLELGTIAHDEVLEVGTDFFKVRLNYIDGKAPGGPLTILKEVWTVRMMGSTDNQFVFDVISEQECATESPLQIEKYHYGGMAIRGSNQWFDDESSDQIKEWIKVTKEKPDTPVLGWDVLDRDYLTNEGKTWHDGNHSRPHWVDMYGKVDGKFTGIAVLAHPTNFRFPQHVRLHPTKPYFCFAPMVDEGFTIEPGRIYRSRYCYVIHDGKPDQEDLNHQWDLFSKR